MQKYVNLTVFLLGTNVYMILKVMGIDDILDLSYVVMVKSTVDISQNFVAFSEYMNSTIFFFSIINSHHFQNHVNICSQQKYSKIDILLQSAKIQRSVGWDY